MKAFAIYTALRLGLFALCFVVFLGIWVPIFGQDGALVWPFIAAVIVSSLLSLRLLARQREDFARGVQARAERATSRFEDIKAREDAE